MKRRRKFSLLNSIRGFTLVELMLSIVIAGAIFGIAAETMIRQADTYSFIANRKSTIADARHALNQMVDELLHVETSDITTITASSITFVDKSGGSTSYSLSTDGSNLAIFRGSNVILPNVSAFDIEYQDENGTALTASTGQIPNVRRIKLTITAAATANEGDISISTLVTPRSFIGYTNYQ